MAKKRILMCTEFSQMPTGYSVYSKEVLSRLHNNYPEFEVAELACYTDANNPEIKKVPWKVFANKPPKNSPEYQEYKSSPIAEFGEFSFNSVVLNFKPDFIFDIRDFWMLAFESNSPFRDFYNWAIMPTVDAKPQNIEWIEAYAGADAIFTYSEFGRDTLLDQSNKINFIDVASPCASDVFCPVENKSLHRQNFGINPDLFIVGTVMRNQRRKLYPDLFKAFRSFLNKTENQNALLYCHTTYPDIGWEIPQLLMEYSLSSKVLFTYKCKKCQKLSCSFFSDALKMCNSCKTFSNMIAGLNNPVSEEELAQVYNLFDLYVQYANSEGFGMPQLEAAQCGIPVASINYSAMQSVTTNIGGVKIPIIEHSLEAETGCKRAIPDNRYFIKILKIYSSYGKETLEKIGKECREKCLAHYSWDDTAKKWADYFLSQEIKPYSETWASPPKIFNPAPFQENIQYPLDQANYLFVNVLGKPEWIGKHMWRRLVRDLTYKNSVESLGGMYFNENHNKDSLRAKPFAFKDAYDSIKKLRDYYNIWEKHRTAK